MRLVAPSLSYQSFSSQFSAFSCQFSVIKVCPPEAIGLRQATDH